MFRGNAPARIDDKGRLKVPNAFRALLEGKYGRELFLTSLTGEYVRIYPMPVWLDVEQKIVRIEITADLLDTVKNCRSQSCLELPSQPRCPT